MSRNCYSPKLLTSLILDSRSPTPISFDPSTLNVCIVSAVMWSKTLYHIWAKSTIRGYSRALSAILNLIGSGFSRVRPGRIMHQRVEFSHNRPIRQSCTHRPCCTLGEANAMLCQSFKQFLRPGFQESNFVAPLLKFWEDHRRSYCTFQISYMLPHFETRAPYNWLGRKSRLNFAYILLQKLGEDWAQYRVRF